MIPGVVINFFTFPGVMLHEWSHKKACEWRGVRVHEVKYINEDLGGHVRHAQPRSFKDILAITMAPFIGNTVVALALYIIAISLYLGAEVMPIPELGAAAAIGMVAFGWLAVSAGYHAFPSFTDTGQIANYRNRDQGWRSTALVVAASPLLILLFIANIGRYVWLDAIYSVGLGYLVWMVFMLL